MHNNKFFLLYLHCINPYLIVMNRFIILFVCILSSLSLSAQLTHRLPTGNACMSVLDYRFYFEGDTIIGGETYTKIYSSYGNTETEWSDKVYFAAVRDDVDSQKIYCVYRNEETIRLLADFDVKQGDVVAINPIKYQWRWFEKEVIVRGVDEIEIDGEMRKRIIISDDSWEEYWIEGIGSTNGLFSPATSRFVDLETPPRLLCFKVGDKMIYQNTYNNSCYLKRIIGSGLLSASTPEFKAYPSLVTDNLCIEGSNWHSYFYRIINLKGEVIATDKLSAVLDLSGLSSGMYLFAIEESENNQRVYSTFFMKQ